jgi:hypothetical protein
MSNLGGPIQPYRGNCHCGASKYQIALPDATPDAVLCNCSYCTKTNALWVRLGDAELVVERGSLDDLRAYPWANKRLEVMIRRLSP